MKIGVITFWDSNDNYGQIMQCYALQTYLKKLGHDVVLIRYIATKNKKKHTFLLKTISKLFSLKHVKCYMDYRRNLKKQAAFLESHPRAFDKFRTKYISSTEKVYVGYRSLWTEDWSSYDALICGSDQVWSYTSEDNLRAFYLNFGQFELKRIAYAASFGRVVLPDDYKTIFPKLLEQIDAIGLREQSGVKLCQDAGRNDAQLVCDPTLLLAGQDYLQNILNKKVQVTDSLFCYLLNWDTLFPYEELKRFVQKEILKVHFVPAHGVEDKQYFEPYSDLSIPSWLHGIASARYAVTNSFHGTVFCILLHRPFVSFPLVGVSSGMNDRLVTLLSYLGLEDRIYSNGTSIEDLLIKPINWADVDDKLQKFQAMSATFLETSLQKKKKTVNGIKAICFQTNGGVNHDFGGLDRVTELLADYFEKQGIKVYYLSFTRRPGTENIRQYYLPDEKKYRSESNIAFYNKFLEEKQIDILINQEGNVNIVLPCNLKRKPLFLTVLHFAPNYIPDYYFEHRISKLNIPTTVKKLLNLLVCHTIIKNCALDYLREKLRKNYQYQVNCCDWFILLSNRFKADLSQFFPGSLPYNICAINNPSTFFPQEAKTTIREKKNVLLYVGRLEIGQKRLDLLLKMWKVLSLEREDWYLKLVGDGPDSSLLKRMVAENKIQRVLFEGKQNPQRYYEEASIFCLTSGAAEGWGMVLVEAQLYGCVPVVFNSYSSVPDIVQDGVTGFVVEAFNESQYIARIRELQQDVNLRQYMSEKCQDNINRFSITHIGGQWLQLFSMAVQRRKKNERLCCSDEKICSTF